MGKKYRFYLIGIVLIIFIGIAFVIFETDDNTKTIVIVTKDQEDTQSLNPTRINVAASLALEDYEKTRSPVKIAHQIITYTGDEEEGYRLAKEYIQNDSSVVAIVGDFNSKGTEFMVSLAEEFEVPHLSFFATDEALFSDKPWSFSYRGRLIHEQEVMLELLTEHVPVSSIAVICSDVSNLKQRWEQLRTKLEGSDVVVHLSELVTSDERNFRLYMDWLVEEQDHYDAIVLFLAAGQIEHFIQQLLIAKIYKPIILSGVNLSPEGVTELQGLTIPMYSFSPRMFLKIGQKNDSDFQSFVDRYRVAMGYHRFDSLGIWVYDGLRLLHSLLQEEENPEQIRYLLEQYEGERMVRPISFDQDGKLRDSIFVPVQILRGQFVGVKNQ